jgi:hypothetical protein
MTLRTCVSPTGHFFFGVHRPGYRVANMRADRRLSALGTDPDGNRIDNAANFPPGDIEVDGADAIIEIPNPFPFRGTTYIIPRHADRHAAAPQSIALPAPRPLSFRQTMLQWIHDRGAAGAKAIAELYRMLPAPLQLAVATTSTDPADLTELAAVSARIEFDPETGRPTGLAYRRDPDGHSHPDVHHPQLFKAVANNPCLPDDYKRIMVLVPGAQGGSEIVGDWASSDGDSHVYEYLRRNSYIPWGHYAANMADDAVRYRLDSLRFADVAGMRHLYYQRTYLRLAEQMGIDPPSGAGPLDGEALEDLRIRIRQSGAAGGRRAVRFDATLWGWNLGSDLSPSGYRLHGSHQQVHQQYALIPEEVVSQESGGCIEAYCCGDLVRDFIRRYGRETGRSFFDCYLEAIANNRRTDGRAELPRRLTLLEDDRVVLFVPKAQTSQWELQLMTKTAVGNVLEADTALRRALDRAIWVAIRVLGRIGARMVTTIEYSKRFSSRDSDQHLLMCFLPKLPQSPGAFSEAQLRWINGHYPEDFAALGRIYVDEVLAALDRHPGS